MELREWLIILGLALVSLIVVDGVRRLQRQRRVPRLDQAVRDLPAAKFEDLDDEAKEAEINWELPNGGARVVKPADYSSLGQKPKLERQEHPGPSKVLSDFRRSFSNSVNKTKASAQFSWSRKHEQTSVAKHSADTGAEPTLGSSSVSETERLEPSLFADNDTPSAQISDKPSQSQTEPVRPAEPANSADLRVDPVSEAIEQPTPEKAEQPMPEPAVKPTPAKVDVDVSEAAVAKTDVSEEASQNHAAQPTSASAADNLVSASSNSDVSNTDVKADTEKAEIIAEKAPNTTATPSVGLEEDEPVLRAEPEDAASAKHASDAPKRRHLRSAADEDRELEDYEVDEYRLVDFEGIGRSFKRRLIERRKEKARKKAEKERLKAEKAKRAEALAKKKAEQKALEAERKALEAQQRREAKEAADAEKARIAQEQAEAREAAAVAAAAEREATQYNEPVISVYDSEEHDGLNQYDDYASGTGHRDNVVRTHPTLEKALRHDVNSERARDTLTDASEMVVISVLSREPEGFDGGKLLELMMVCGLRYSREMGVFHRFETESSDSALQFSMVNVLKPGTFPIEEMDEFVTPGITLLMPLPGAVDSSAAFEAMVETAMVLVRHMGGELKDENRSVMTAQTIEFARQRVHEFERRHRLHRHMQAR
ncbi:cell division protein ZipA [Vreelandella zhaodongensis]|uniref:Cell division protein ZipA n=1 Tax=Vreelandella zhaodongensis TaxID=1176240 RepID=A0ABX2SUF3_VREZH|nr:cell division protein ZipA [Halomonas zhaodongensis]NYS45069.1 cell division protein ZipA [Halomonas zhaodongensis]